MADLGGCEEVFSLFGTGFSSSLTPGRSPQSGRTGWQPHGTAPALVDSGGVVVQAAWATLLMGWHLMGVRRPIRCCRLLRWSGRWIQVMMGRTTCWRRGRRWRSRTFLWSSAKNDSIAALSPQAPARPIDPARPLLRSVRMKAADRNWLPLSECTTTVPAGERSAMALRSAETARAAVIWESME